MLLMAARATFLEMFDNLVTFTLLDKNRFCPYLILLLTYGQCIDDWIWYLLSKTIIMNLDFPEKLSTDTVVLTLKSCANFISDQNRNLN